MRTAAAWMETADRTVCSTEFANLWVSTVFLSLDHNHRGGPPVLFETMVFAKEGASDIDYLGLNTRRYCTIEDARAGHALICEDIKRLEIEAAALSMGLVSRVPQRAS